MISPGYAEHRQGEQTALLDLADEKDIVALNSLLSDNNTLHYLAVYKKMSALSYTELDGLLGKAGNILSAKALAGLIEGMMTRKEDEGIFLLREDIIINNTPVLSGSPFYGKSRDGLKITALKAHAERFYFDNLRLKYRKNRLLNESDKLWINPKALSRQAQSDRKPDEALGKNTVIAYEKLAKKAQKTWSYRLKSDNLSDFYFDLRQWPKRYEEDLTDAAITEDAVIIRNEYRLFCVDLLTGREIWSFGDAGKNRCDLTHAFRHPHQNSYGGEILLSDNTIFTELAGKLVAVSIKDLFSPLLLWEVSLGEYTAAAKPIQSGMTLMATLINTRGELWVCGFNSQNGNLEWSTYIGTSSFLSPVCEIHSIINDKIIIGTNHGVLICLDRITGEIIWLHKYAPKRYSLYDYWIKGYYKDKLFNTGSIAYDTQFLNSVDNQVIYYKPRESDHSYILDPGTGRSKEEILIDPDKFFLLGAQNNKAVFLKKKGFRGNNMELKIVELNSGKQLFNKMIPAGALEGVIKIDENSIAFKLGDRVHFLMSNGNKIGHHQAQTKAAGRLLSFKDGLMIIKDGPVISCVDLCGKKGDIGKNDPQIAEYFKRNESIKERLQLMLKPEREGGNSVELRNSLLAQMKEFKTPLAEILPVIIKNLQKVRWPEWNAFFTGLTNLYGEEAINYKGIDMKFSNLIHEEYPGLKGGPARSDQRTDNKHSSGNSFRVRGDTIIPIPIRVIKKQGLPGFFLVLNNDQLICAAEDGDILWERKIFFCPGWKILIRDSKIVPADTTIVKAYLYNDTLIINDGVDLLALKAIDGSYLWSMTNHGDLIIKEIHPPAATFYSEKYSLRGTKFKDEVFYTEFFDDSLLVASGEKVYLIDPLTGYCRNYCELQGVSPIGVKVSKDRILIFTVDSLKVLGRELTIIADLAFDASVGRKDMIPGLSFAKENDIIKINSRLYKLDPKAASLKDILTINVPESNYLDSFEEKILIVSPFQEVAVYHFEGDQLKPDWQYSVGPVNGPVFWHHRNGGSKYYFIYNDRLLLPVKKPGGYFLVCLDLRTGKMVWEQHLKGVNGLFYNLSNAVNANGKINFIIATVDCGRDENRIEMTKEASTTNNVYINSSFFWLYLASGKIAKTEKLPVICAEGYKNSSIVETEGYFIYGINGNMVRACKK